MILIEQRDLSGSLKRCDAKCYNAHGKKCRCLCGGSNHGIGLNKAINNLNLVAQKILDFPIEKLSKGGGPGAARIQALDQEAKPIV